MKSARLNPSPPVLDLVAFDRSSSACSPAFLDFARFLLLAFAVFPFWAGSSGGNRLVAAEDGAGSEVLEGFVLRLEIGVGAGSFTSVSRLQWPQVITFVIPAWCSAPLGLSVRRLPLPLCRLAFSLSFLISRRLPRPGTMMWPQHPQTCSLSASLGESSCSNRSAPRLLMR